MPNKDKIKKIIRRTIIVVLSAIAICLFAKIAFAGLIGGFDFTQYKYIGDTRIRMIEIDPGGAKVFSYDKGPFIAEAFDPYIIFYNQSFLVAHGTQGIECKPHFVIIELPTKDDAEYTDCIVHEFHSSDEYEQIIKEKNIELEKMEQTDAHIPWRFF